MRYIPVAPLGAFLCFVVRILIKGATLGDALALSALAGLFGFTLYLEAKKQEPLDEAVRKELEQMKSIISALKVQKSFTRGA